MTKKSRTILFVLIAILFILITPLVILHFQGYRFDFENKKFFQTGAFSFKIWPRDAQIFIDGKPTKKPVFPFGPIYIENLLPKKYIVEIKKESYLLWEKNLEVKERLVTENKNIFLVPENPQFNFLEKEVMSFFLSPDGKKAVFKKIGGESWNLFLFDLEKNVSSLLFSKGDFSEKEEKIDFIGLEWSADSKKILLKTKAKENKYFVIEIGEKPNLYPLNFLKNGVADVSFSPQDSQKIFFNQSLLQKNSLFSIDYKNGEISGPILNNFLTFEPFNNSFFWLDRDGFLHQSDFSGNPIRQSINKEPLPLTLDAQYQDFQYQLFLFSENKIFLKEDNKFCFFDRGNQSLEKILDGVKEIKISPDFQKIVYFTNNEIWILFLKKIEEQPQRTEGERLFLARFSEKIGNIFWWTSHYLIFSVGSEIKIAEIDDRDRINIYDLAKFPNLEIFWNNINKKLYILTQGNLFSSEKLLP